MLEKNLEVEGAVAALRGDIAQRAQNQERHAEARADMCDGAAEPPISYSDLAYMQMLGTLVDFKLYDNKANLR